MKRHRVIAAMARARAERFPVEVQEKMIDWNIVCSEGQVAFELNVPGVKEPVRFSLEPYDAYDMMLEIGQAYDVSYGII